MGLMKLTERNVGTIYVAAEHVVSIRSVPDVDGQVTEIVTTAAGPEPHLIQVDEDLPTVVGEHISAM